MSRLLRLLPVLSFWLSGCANSLFYFPDRIDYEPRLARPVAHEVVWVPTPSGPPLFAWWLKAVGAPRATVLFLHGNAQNLTAHAAFVDWLPAAGYNVLIVDYRGYGLSSGEPDRAGQQVDARAAYDYARRRADATPERMILLGQSLGGANALTLAGRERLPGLKAVVADSAFSNYGRIAREKMLGVPVLGWLSWPFSPLIVSSGLSPDATIARISPVPLLLIAGGKDAIVPATHSQRLFALARPPKQLWELDDAGHTEALGRLRARVLPKLLAFLEAALRDDAVLLQTQAQEKL